MIISESLKKAEALQKKISIESENEAKAKERASGKKRQRIYRRYSSESSADESVHGKFSSIESRTMST